jgi:hypothetical protein
LSRITDEDKCWTLEGPRETDDELAQRTLEAIFEILEISADLTCERSHSYVCGLLMALDLAITGHSNSNRGLYFALGVDKPKPNNGELSIVPIKVRRST